MPLPSTEKSTFKKKFSIKGGQFSEKELKKQFESRDGQVIYLKNDEDIRIRFLVEPDEFYSFAEHSLQLNSKWTTVPCIGDGCPACDDDGARTSQKVLIPVWDVEKKKVRLFKANGRTAQDILKYHSKGRLLGRDWTLMRQGDGVDTRYLLDPEEPSKRKETKNAEIPDMEKILKGWVTRAYGGTDVKSKKSKDDDEDFEEENEDEDEEDTKKKKKKSKDEDEDDDEDEDEKPKKKKKSSDDDDDEDEDEDEDKPKKKKKSSEDDEDDDDEDEDEDDKPKKKKKSKEDDDDDEDDEDDDEDEEPKKPKKPKKKSKDDDDDDDDDD